MIEYQPKKIFFYIENDQFGGLDTFVMSLIKYWPNKKDKIILIHNHNHPGAISYQEISNLAIVKKLHIPISFEISKFFFGFLGRRFQKLFNPLFKILFYPFQLRFITNAFKTHDADILMVINGGFPGGETCRLANIAWFKLYCGARPNFHNFHNLAIVPTFGTNWFENYIDAKFLKSISGIISVSKTCASSINVRPSLKNLKASHIYNGIDFDKSKNIKIPSQIKELGIKDKKKCIMLANYEERKGHDFVIRAFQNVLRVHPDAQLVLCGAGKNNAKSKLRDFIRKKQLNKNIHVLDFINNASSFISYFDVLLVGSQKFESFGLVVAEAMMSKTPVVSTAIGGLNEVLEGQIGGYLVPINENDIFSDHIINLFSSKSLRTEIGMQGFLRANNNFDAKVMSQKYHDRLVNNLKWTQKTYKGYLLSEQS